VLHLGRVIHAKYTLEHVDCDFLLPPSFTYYAAHFNSKIQKRQLEAKIQRRQFTFNSRLKATRIRLHVRESTLPVNVAWNDNFLPFCRILLKRVNHAKIHSLTAIISILLAVATRGSYRYAESDCFSYFLVANWRLTRRCAERSRCAAYRLEPRRGNGSAGDLR